MPLKSEKTSHRLGKMEGVSRWEVPLLILHFSRLSMFICCCFLKCQQNFLGNKRLGLFLLFSLYSTLLQ